MINTINPHQIQRTNKPNFKAIIPVKKVLIQVGNDISEGDNKNLESAINQLVNIFLKLDKSELPKNPETIARNILMRKALRAIDEDYKIPGKANMFKRDDGIMRTLENLNTGDQFILTGYHAKTLQAASNKIAGATTPTGREKSLSGYGETARNLLAKINPNTPKMIIWGVLEKSKKITPLKIAFEN